MLLSPTSLPRVGDIAGPTPPTYLLRMCSSWSWLPEVRSTSKDGGGREESLPLLGPSGRGRSSRRRIGGDGGPGTAESRAERGGGAPCVASGRHASGGVTTAPQCLAWGRCTPPNGDRRGFEPRGVEMAPGPAALWCEAWGAAWRRLQLAVG